MKKAFFILAPLAMLAWLFIEAHKEPASYSMFAWQLAICLGLFSFVHAITPKIFSRQRWQIMGFFVGAGLLVAYAFIPQSWLAAIGTALLVLIPCVYLQTRGAAMHMRNLFKGTIARRTR